jgi:hypothetical protein
VYLHACGNSPAAIIQKGDCPDGIAH